MAGSHVALLLFLFMRFTNGSRPTQEGNVIAQMSSKSAIKLLAPEGQRAISESISAMRAAQVPSEVATAAKLRTLEDIKTHAMHLVAKHGDGNFSEAQVGKALDGAAELQQAVAEHLEASQVPAKLAGVNAMLIQRAGATLGKEKMKSFDKVLRDKTPCACMAVNYNHIHLADLDKEGDWGDNDHCGKRCPAVCHSESKYKMDPGEAEEIGAEDVTESMSASKCEDGSCKCLDATQSVRNVRANGFTDISHNMETHSSPRQCLDSCADTCDDYDQPGCDWEGVCMDEWDFGLEREFKRMARDAD